MKKIEMTPIGYVKNGITGHVPHYKTKDIVSRIILNPGSEDMLDGIGSYSHVFVIFRMHKVSVKDRKTRRIQFPGGLEVGILATRVQFRENAIGLTTAELIVQNRNELVVKALEAFNGTPVLDIKPYTDFEKDRPLKSKVIVAPWAGKRPVSWK